MTPAGRTIVAGLAGAVLLGFAQGTALPAVGDGIIDAARSGHDYTTVSLAKSGRLYCGLPTEIPGGGAVVTADTLNQLVVLHVGTWRNGNSEIRIHRRALHEVFWNYMTEVGGALDSTESYRRYIGTEITPQNDRIVAIFKHNVLLQAKLHDSISPKGASNISGFKILLGRHSDRDENGREIEFEVYFRIIVDWTNQVRRASELSFHRAAFVISQVLVGTGDLPAREMLYRFLPNNRPLRALFCGLDPDQAT